MTKPTGKPAVETPAATSAAPAKRRMLTPEERVAKLEADLAAARKKAEAKSRKHADTLLEQRNKLAVKRDEILGKIDKIDAELRALNVDVDAILSEGAPTEEDHRVLEGKA